MKALVLLVVVAFGILVAVHNPGYTAFDYVVAQSEIPTSWLIVGSFAAGTILGAMVIGAGALKCHRRARRWQREAELARQEVVNLRSLPLNSP